MCHILAHFRNGKTVANKFNKEKNRSMKKIFIMLFSVLAVSAGMMSCSDSETDPADKKVEPTDSTEKKDTLASDTADYTVIYWGMAGGDLDPAVAIDLNTLVKNYCKGRIGKNVNIAGLLKTSVGFYRNIYKEDPIPQDSDKTWYFDSREISPDTLKKENNAPTNAQLLQDYQTVFKAFGAKEYADKEFPLNNSDSLATFIKRTAEAFPARHYVLLLWGHGTAFQPGDEQPYTRGCVLDKYVDEMVGLTTSTLVKAVEKSGVKVQTLFTQCCLMGALENMAVYSRVFDYAFLSAEVTTAFYFPEYLVYLSQAGDNEEKMKKASRDLVDFYVKNCNKGTLSTTSHGFYDLTKTSQLLDVVKEAAEWYVSNYGDADLKKKIDWALAHAVYCHQTDKEDAIADCKTTRQYIYDKMEGKASSYDREALVKVFTAWTNLVNNFGGYSYGYCLSDVMRQTLEVLPTDKKASLQGIYDRYMKTLKSMAYIQASHVPANADSDYPYIYASPTVNIFSMDPNYYIPLTYKMNDEVTMMIDAMVEGNEATASTLYHKLFEGSLQEACCPISAAETLYKASDFNLKTGWTDFLEKLTFNPGYYVNPDRSVVNESME